MNQQNNPFVNQQQQQQPQQQPQAPLVAQNLPVQQNRGRVFQGQRQRQGLAYNLRAPGRVQQPMEAINPGNLELVSYDGTPMNLVNGVADKVVLVHENCVDEISMSVLNSDQKLTLYRPNLIPESSLKARQDYLREKQLFSVGLQQVQIDTNYAPVAFDDQSLGVKLYKTMMMEWTLTKIDFTSYNFVLVSLLSLYATIDDAAMKDLVSLLASRKAMTKIYSSAELGNIAGVINIGGKKRSASITGGLGVQTLLHLHEIFYWGAEYANAGDRDAVADRYCSRFNDPQPAIDTMIIFIMFKLATGYAPTMPADGAAPADDSNQYYGNVMTALSRSTNIIKSVASASVFVTPNHYGLLTGPVPQNLCGNYPVMTLTRDGAKTVLGSIATHIYHPLSITNRSAQELLELYQVVAVNQAQPQGNNAGGNAGNNAQGNPQVPNAPNLPAGQGGNQGGNNQNAPQAPP